MGTLRKIYIAVECEDDQEKELVQQMANELSNMRILKSRTLLSMLPVFNNNRQELSQLFSMVSSNGIKSLLSIQGGLLIKKLASKK